MERHRLNSEEAFQVLRQISQNRNIKLREVACDWTAERSVG
ncbi:ANTAR domain-containing protein [Actinopolymorpha sp. NPDC004070]